MEGSPPLARPPSGKALSNFWKSESLGPIILALTVGLVGGSGAILFRFLIQGADRLSFGGGAQVLSFLGGTYVIVLPAFGLVIVSYVVRRWAPEAEGHGVPEVMYAVKKEGGRIRPRVAGIKAVVSAICIGTGGSVGREGPIVQIGCGFGSSLGQFLKLDEERIKLLVTCGAAAGIAGTFNAPIAGVIFAMEVILGNFTARSFGLVVISSVTSTALCRAILGEEQAFALVRIFELQSWGELPLYALLGLLAGVAAFSFVTVLYFLDSLLHRWTWPPSVKALVAGLGVGAIGYFGIRYLGGRYLFGVGYDGIVAALNVKRQAALDLGLAGGATFTACALLVLLKIPATSLSLAGGGSGGIFAPSIFIGAMLGAAFGMLANAVLPGVTAPPGAYALVGMGAVFAGSAHAPITSILILFEMTDDYEIILPLMTAVVISYLVSSHLNPDSVYTIKLRRRGGLSPPTPRLSILDQILVADAMTSDLDIVRPDESVQELASRFYGSHTRAYTPKESMRSVLQKFASRDVGQIPVVSEDDPAKLVGSLRRGEILWTYGQLALEHRRMLLENLQALPTEHGEAVHVELEVRAGNERLAYRRLRDIQVPDQCLIVVVHRGEHAIVPRGNTVVEPGDRLVLLTIRARERKLRNWVETNT